MSSPAVVSEQVGTEVAKFLPGGLRRIGKVLVVLGLAYLVAIFVATAYNRQLAYRDAPESKLNTAALAEAVTGLYVVALLFGGALALIVKMVRQ